MKKLETPKVDLSLHIDKKFLYIDFIALSLIQMALFAIPTRDIVVRLKKLFGIGYLTSQEVLQELNNINSPLRKYLNAMMMSFVIRCQLLLEESFQNILIMLMKKQKKNLLAELRRIHQSRNKLKIPAFKQKLIVLNEVAVDTLETVSQEIFPLVKTFALEGHRYDLLKFYLGYADAKLAPMVVEMVNSHINMLILGYQTYEEVSQAPNLSELQQLRLHEWLERRISRIEALNPKNIQKILPNLPLVDPVSLKQHLLNIMKGDMIEYRKLQGIQRNLELIEEEEIQVSEDTARKDRGTAPQISIDKKFGEYRVFQNSLNDLFIDIFDRHEGVLIYEALTILNFLEMLAKVVQKKNITPRFLSELKIAAFDLRDKLNRVADVDYSEIINCINQMYGKDIALEQQYANTHSKLTEEDRTTVPASMNSGVDEKNVELSQSANDDRIKKTEINELENSATSIIKPTPIEPTVNPIFQPLTVVISEMLTHQELPEELQVSLTKFIEQLKNPFLTQELADQMIESYNLMKNTFLMFDKSLKFMEELKKLPLINEERLIKDNDAEQDLGF